MWRRYVNFFLYISDTVWRLRYPNSILLSALSLGLQPDVPKPLTIPIWIICVIWGWYYENLLIYQPFVYTIAIRLESRWYPTFDIVYTNINKLHLSHLVYRKWFVINTQSLFQSAIILFIIKGIAIPMITIMIIIIVGVMLLINKSNTRWFKFLATILILIRKGSLELAMDEWLSGKTSYRQISRSLESSGLGVKIIVLLWNLTGIAAAVLLRPVKFQNNWKCSNPNLAASNLREILR